MQPSSSAPVTPSDEIDLRELILTLWASRLLIIATTLLVLAAAAAYAFLSTPVYETQAQTLPPPKSGLASYNNAYQMSGPAAASVSQGPGDARGSQQSTIDDAIPELTTENAYGLFMRHAASTSLRQDFFEDYYLKHPSNAQARSDAEITRLWKQFNSALTITLPRKPEDNNRMQVALQGDDPVLIAEWVNRYLEMAIHKTQAEFSEDLISAVHLRENSLQEQAETLRDSAEKQRKNEIARLQEALALAESIGLEDPPSTGNLITSYSGDTMYMRGARTLRGEIELLKNRQSDDPFIENLPGILKRIELLKHIDPSPELIMVATIDEPARAPQAPVKPRKALILALGIVLGGMLGIFIALMRQMFRN